MRHQTITLETLKQFDQELAGNWKKYDSFGWHDSPDPRRFTLINLASRDADLITESNKDVIERELSDCSGVTKGRSAHWAVGYIDTLILRIKNRHGHYSEAFIKYVALALAMESYPILDEHDLSEKQCEAETQAWESWVRSEFQDELTKRFPEHEERIESLTEDQIYVLFHGAAELANEYFELESSGVIINVKRVAAKVSAEDLLSADLP